MEKLPGPDFPTAAIINGHSGIRQAYETGRGRIYIRARVEVEEKKDTLRSGAQQTTTKILTMTNRNPCLFHLATG